MSTIASDRRLLAGSGAVFLCSVAATIFLCQTMAGGMRMPGGWTMSMAWMRMPGQTWLGAALSFQVMWLVMMLAMMILSLVPSLSSYGRTAGEHKSISLVAAGYFFVWSIYGVAVYPPAVMLTQAEMRWRALARSVPVATGAVIMLAGVLQLTSWKARQLDACRDSVGCAAGPWRHGLLLGLRCALCCCGFMSVLLVAGVMDLRAMGVITAAITAERLAPRPALVARIIGAAIVLVAAVMVGRALMTARL